MKPIVIFGNGSVAESAQFYFEHDSDLTVAAFTVDGDFCKEPHFCKRPLIAFENMVRDYPPDKYDIFIALSYRDMNSFREKKFKEAAQMGYEFASYISSRAIVWSKQIGRNCFIHDNNVIQPFSKIGDNVTLWTANVVGHHTIVEDHCFISGHAAISGEAVIGQSSFVGANATIRDGIRIGKNNIIGAGVTILKSTQDNQIYASERVKPYPLKLKKI